MNTQPQPITGIEIVDRFIAQLPEQFTKNGELKNPLCLAFNANGTYDLIGVINDGAARDDYMNAVANAVIAYSKTCKPLAIVILSETFVQTVQRNKGRLPAVDCDRFAIDEAYREEVLRTREERFSAIVETEALGALVSWRIIRDGSHRRLEGFKIDKEFRTKVLRLAGELLGEQFTEKLIKKASFKLGAMLLMGDILNTSGKMKKFIEGFN